MKRVILSTWHSCAETGARMKKGSVAYQDTETRKVYCLCTKKVEQWLSVPEDGSIIPNEEPVPNDDVSDIKNLSQIGEQG